MHSVTLANSPNEILMQFFLPGHKANRFFERNIIILHQNPFKCNPVSLFTRYLASQDGFFLLSSPLLLKRDGTVLTSFFKKDVGGQSVCASGVTSLAENRVAPHII
jgi:hypothetical protein